jgi:hypothetical protein
MAGLGGGSHQTVTTNDKFIPEIWSDEVIGVYKNSIVAAPLVKKMPFKGKKGDTVHVPKPGRGSANAKVANTVVTLNVDTATELQILIDQHFEYSRVIEDITEIQSLAGARAFYTDDAGYALSKLVDTAVLANAATFQSGTAYDEALDGATGAVKWDPTANATTGNGANLTDIGIRRLIQVLDDQDVPADMRSLLINPGQKNVLLGIDRFNSSDFVNQKGVQTGLFGEVYGIPVYTTTNLATVTGSDTTTDYKVCVMMHKEAIVHAEQMGIRTQTQYKQEFLGTLFTADTIYGTKTYRPESGVGIVVPA